MSSKKSKSLQERKTEKDRIFEFLTKELEFSKDKPQEDGSIFFEKTVPGQTRQMIINGQASVQQEPDRIIKIEYYGEGSISNSDGSNAVPIWGFKMYDDDIPVGATHYVDSLEDFRQTFLR